ncbi:hypothetical protein NL108_014730 [Boleophthalmus pectinirostris]|nr:hypothetical protein NL108_014730 [Boleophthalmus pectinirostris]
MKKICELREKQEGEKEEEEEEEVWKRLNILQMVHSSTWARAKGILLLFRYSVTQTGENPPVQNHTRRDSTDGVCARRHGNERNSHTALIDRYHRFFLSRRGNRSTSRSKML